MKIILISLVSYGFKRITNSDTISLLTQNKTTLDATLSKALVAKSDSFLIKKLPVFSVPMMHSPNDKLRQWLVPTAGENSVKDLIDAGQRYFLKTGRRVTFEYALIQGINDSVEIAKELALLLKNNGSHVNLIPLNPTAGDFERPARKNVIEFERILYNSGVNCTVRVEKGTEISAACGQLRTDVLGKYNNKRE